MSETSSSMKSLPADDLQSTDAGASIERRSKCERGAPPMQDDGVGIVILSLAMLLGMASGASAKRNGFVASGPSSINAVLHRGTRVRKVSSKIAQANPTKVVRR
jgi:hypothetical protein